ncbi:hypothetical protein [Marinobacter sp.]|uniref:hypothetical protein n=1 Tax=Marinobacter sp. TaxID=50741 RepID=UPI00384E76A4
MEIKKAVAGLGIFILGGCSDSNPTIEPPTIGGQLVHLQESDYSLMVRYRDGTLIETTATLVDENDMPAFIKSMDGEIIFQVPDCGKLTFIEPNFVSGVILKPDDAYFATDSKDCPIHFGALEDKWVIK